MQNEEDVIFEEENEEENPKSLIKKLRDKIKSLEAEKEEYLTGWQKERADGVNLRKRSDEEKKEFTRYANEALVMELLTTLDSFDMAFKNKEEWEKLPKNWTSGIEYIYNQLLSTLEGYGVKKLSPKGEDFDPSRDEALEIVEVEDKDKNHKILEVIQPGYQMNEKNIRSVKVKLGEYKK